MLHNHENKPAVKMEHSYLEAKGRANWRIISTVTLPISPVQYGWVCSQSIVHE